MHWRLKGALSTSTVPLKADLTLHRAVSLGSSMAAIAKATGREVEQVTERPRATGRALEQGASIGAATTGVVRYHPPADAAASNEPRRRG